MGLTLISPLQGFRFIKPKPRVALRSTLGYLIPPRWGFGRVDRLLHGVVAEAWRGNIGVAFFGWGYRTQGGASLYPGLSHFAPLGLRKGGSCAPWGYCGSVAGKYWVAFFRVGFPPGGIGLKCPFGGLTLERGAITLA